jgi:hypothetical protein
MYMNFVCLANWLSVSRMFHPCEKKVGGRRGYLRPFSTLAPTKAGQWHSRQRIIEIVFILIALLAAIVDSYQLAASSAYALLVSLVFYSTVKGGISVLRLS